MFKDLFLVYLLRIDSGGRKVLYLLVYLDLVVIGVVIFIWWREKEGLENVIFLELYKMNGKVGVLDGCRYELSLVYFI